MLCPNDQTTLVMADRQGVEIDYCPTCRGVWLDRGELDKIIDRAVDALPAAAAPTPAGPKPTQPYDDRRVDRSDDRRYDDRRRYDDDYRKYDDSRRYGDDDYRRRKKKESWLGDLFDF
jgi:uncharacterized protein